MAMGLFVVGIDEVDDVLEIRRTAIEQLANGGLVLTNWSSESTSVTKVQGISLSTLIQECNAFLQIADPDTYGRRITRTRPFYI